MNNRFSLSRFLHNDKLMMLVSLLLAILVWALVVYGPSNAQDQEITGVPVSITLNDYASQTLNLRITEGANATATVTVHGLRSVVSKLSAADITVTADTGNVIKEGTYTLSLRAVSSGDYTIKSVVGDNGTNDTVTITCDAWKEAAFNVSVEMPGLVPSEEQKLQFGTPVISSEAVVDGQITVSGPRTDVNRVAAVAAVIPDETSLSEATVFTARLEARDDKGNIVDNVAFNGAEDGTVSVTVPIMVYRKVNLSPSLVHIPKAYSSADLISISPASVELWGVPSELDEYIASVQDKIQLDFDQVSPDTLTHQITLDTVEGIRPVNGSETVTVQVKLKNISSVTMDVPLSASNFSAVNIPAGNSVKLMQNKLTGIRLCGAARELSKVRPEDIRVIVDLANTATAGQQTVKARVSVLNHDGVWVYYGDAAHGVDVLVSIEQS